MREDLAKWCLFWVDAFYSIEHYYMINQEWREWKRYKQLLLRRWFSWNDTWNNYKAAFRILHLLIGFMTNPWQVSSFRVVSLLLQMSYWTYCGFFKGGQPSSPSQPNSLQSLNVCFLMNLLKCWVMGTVWNISVWIFILQNSVLILSCHCSSRETGPGAVLTCHSGYWLDVWGYTISCNGC